MRKTGKGITYYNSSPNKVYDFEQYEEIYKRPDLIAQRLGGNIDEIAMSNRLKRKVRREKK